MASFNGFPVPESILRLGDGKNSSDSLCSATLPILLHIMYQIPALKTNIKITCSPVKNEKNHEQLLVIWNYAYLQEYWIQY